jgi:hypothetical protein
MEGPDRGPVLSGVKNLITGIIKYGINHNRDRPKDPHPLLKSFFDDFDAKFSNPKELYPNAKLPGDHSEIYALNDALWAYQEFLDRPLVEDDLNVFVIHNEGLWKNRGKDIARCPFCFEITSAIPVTDNVARADLVRHGQTRASDINSIYNLLK